MSNFDRMVYSCSPRSLDTARRLDPAASDFSPSSSLTDHQLPDSMSKQVGAHPSPPLEARILGVEEKHANLRRDVDNLSKICQGLSMSVDQLKKGGSSGHVEPFKKVDANKSHQNAMEHKLKLDKLIQKVHESPSGVADKEKTRDMSPPKKIVSLPPHLRAKSGNGKATATKPVTSHSQSAVKSDGLDENEINKPALTESPNNPLVTDGQVDKSHGSTKPVPAQNTPTTPHTVIPGDMPSLENLSLGRNWEPHYITTLAALPSIARADIPVMPKMVTFHADFIHNTFDGLAWSPGLLYIQGKGSCLLKNRTYYLLDPTNEPFLPKTPGAHGAKLTAFFNKAPEEEFGPLEDGNSYEDVPMFVKTGNRYMYFGNYSQTRWSDKLDYDAMTARVPQHVREYWAAELTSATREKWVADELKKHFFKKPEYEGRLFAALDDGNTTTSAEEVKFNERMTKDVKKYVEELREWEREADMRVSMIKKDFILDAFDRADADDPPALRLWWEYLECVGWRKDFYNLLVTLQSRNPAQAA